MRLQRPTASFGQIEGKRHTLSLQGQKVDLPIRLSGEPPWIISFSKRNEASHKIYTKRLEASNDILEADSQDTYTLEEVHDKFCPGTVDCQDQFIRSYLDSQTNS